MTDHAGCLPALTLADALRLVEAAEARAREIGVPMAIAVVDAGGHPIEVRRMDGAPVAAMTTVVAKARTAVHFRTTTEALVEGAKAWPEVYQSWITVSGGQWVLSKGGVPLWKNGHVVGGIGCSGGTGAQDITCAETARDRAGFAAGPE
ncbi:MAG: heme-binding protein [Chloroflexota bacterium]|nr:heme-binding protein [Dehalococcoidia bacterium]MDW8253123.1 heme-binding protein [Chloroflexota bacterium]